jgi:diguanylate cyclase (GGDEF)-like protein/PAS domain S-box-containing protein
MNEMATAAIDIFNDMLDAMGVGGWDYDVAAQLLSWNRVMHLIHDVPSSETPSLEMALDCYTEELRPAIRSAIRLALIDGTPWNLDLQMVTASGRHICVNARGRAIREAGETTRLSGTVRDLTSRSSGAKWMERISELVRELAACVILVDTKGQIASVNNAFVRQTGYHLPEVLGRSHAQILQGPETDPATLKEILEHRELGKCLVTELQLYRKDGTPCWQSITGAALRDESGLFTGYMYVGTDISAHRSMEKIANAELRRVGQAEALLRDVINALPVAVSVWDQNEHLIMTNPAYAEMFPIAGQFAVVGRSLRDVVRLSAEAGQYLNAGVTAEERDLWISGWMQQYCRPGATEVVEFPNDLFVQLSQRKSGNGNLVCVRTDISRLKRVEAELKQQTECDPLTGLASRTSFIEALSIALGPQHNATQGRGALILLDIDFFKQVNDTLGHPAGDELLLEIAARLRSIVRPSEVPARLGGDEFALLVPGLLEDQTADARVATIIKAISTPASICGKVIHPTFSAGVAWFPRDAADVKNLFWRADLALYDAKRAGRARWCRFRPERAAILESQVRASEHLRAAIAERKIQIAFQPKQLLRGGHAGFEAMARWHDGTEWAVATDLSKAATDIGMGQLFGHLIIDLALERICLLRGAGANPGPVVVNVCASQLLESKFTKRILSALDRHKLSPAHLELEITEAVLIDRAADRIERVLRQLRAAGIALALGDCGTGVTSLAHIARMPFNRLKIDRSFVSEVGRRSHGTVMAQTIIGLARSLRMQSVADGVETQRQLAFFRAEGCDALQGRLISPPLITLDDVLSYLFQAQELPAEWALQCRPAKRAELASCRTTPEAQNVQ